MKRYHSLGKSALIALLVTIFIGATLGCSESEDSPAGDPVLQSIAVTGPPTKTVYAQGETFEIGGLVVTGTYSDGTSKQETVSLSNISGYNPNLVGQQTLTVTLNGKTATFPVTVNAGGGEATLQSIAITSQPTKTVYTQGETFEIGGLVVTGTYSDGTSKQETVSLSNISGYNPNLVGQQTLTVTLNGKTAYFTVTVNASGAVLQSIAITNQPTKTVYTQGEAFEIGGLVVTGTYSDGTSKQETVSLSNISGYNPNLVGQQTLTVTLNGKTAYFTVTVNAVLQSIAITSPPAKTEYVVGEALDISGLVVTGTYADGTTKEETVSASNISGYNPNLVGQQTLTVTLNGKTAYFTVTVNAVLQSIAITSPPAKTEYVVGEALDISGLVVTGTYADGTTKEETVSASNISGYNPNLVGQQTLTVTLNGKTATFAVTINPAVLQSIVITSPPTKTVYTEGEAFEISGLVVTGTYSDGTSKAETVSLSNVSGYNPNLVGQQTLTVTLNGKTATFTITVNPTAVLSVHLDDPLLGDIADAIVLSKRGTPTALTLEIIGAYASYQWLLNDRETPVSTSASYVLNAADCLLGANSLVVEVSTTAGAYYSREITFIVNREGE